MQARYSLQNREDMIAIDAEHTDKGKLFLYKYRREHPRQFARRRIRDVLQAYPSKVPLRKVYELTYSRP